MKHVFFEKKQQKTFALGIWLLGISPAVANSQCIWERDLDHTEVVDDSTILFHMHGHKVWKNTLQVRCFGLKHEPDGFTYQPTDPGTQELCSNQVTIRLNSFKSVCQLGNFSEIK